MLKDILLLTYKFIILSFLIYIKLMIKNLNKGESKKDKNLFSLGENFDKIKNPSFFDGGSCFPFNSFFHDEAEANENCFIYDNILDFENDEQSFIVDNPLNKLNIQSFDKKSDLYQKNICFENKDFFTFKKNRNIFNNYSLYEKNNFCSYVSEKEKTINNNSQDSLIISNEPKENHSNFTFRCDSLLIKFKSALGKWFILKLNNKLKNILKRKIKLFAFNYKKFTIVVNYSKNRMWLDEKIKDLLVLGDENNQDKNKKALIAIYKKKIEPIKEIKEILEQNYRAIIKQFYLSEEFIKFKNDKRVIELNNNFIKIMNISILESNGFIKFLECRKGNLRKK